MKWTCKQDVIFRELLCSLDFTQQKGGFPIYSNVFLGLEGDTLEIKATNLNYGYRSSVKVHGSEDGKLIVLADKLTEIVKNLKDEELEFCSDEEFLNISSVTSTCSYRIRYSSDKSFQFKDKIESNVRMAVPRDIFAEMADKTLASVSRDETEVAICGVKAEFTSDSLTLASTDRVTFTYYRKEFAFGDSADGLNMLIPAKFMRDIVKIVPPDTVIDFMSDGVALGASFGDSFMWTTLIKAGFPGYEKLIGGDYEYSVEFVTSDMMRTLLRASVMSNDRDKKVCLRFSDGALTVSSLDGDDLGSGEESLPCSFDGEEMGFSVFTSSFANLLKAMDSERFLLSFSKTMRRVMLQPLPGKEYMMISVITVV